MPDHVAVTAPPAATVEGRAGTDVAGVGRVGERPIAAQRHAAVGRIAGRAAGERAAVNVSVVGQQTGGEDRPGRVLGNRVAVVDGVGRVVDGVHRDADGGGRV